MKNFLEKLYVNCKKGQIETRALPGGKCEFHDLGDWSSIEAWCEEHSDADLYFAVATRKGGGTKKHIVEIPAVWVDVDFKDSTKKEARKRIKEFPLQPSVRILSGGGYHFYWKLKKPAGKNDIPKIEQINKWLASCLGGDTSAAEAARILRLPGMLNYKYKPPKKVWLGSQKGPHYKLGELLDAARLESAPSKVHALNNNEHTDIGECQATAHEITKPSVTKTGHSVTVRDICFEVGHHDETLFSIAWHLARGGMPFDKVLKTIEFIAHKLDPDNETKKWAKKIVKSAFDRLGRREGRLSEQIRDWISVTSGAFSVTECDKELDIVTQRDRDNRRQIFKRLLKKGTIERVRGKNNLYRRVECDCEDIDFLAALGEERKAKWPMGIEKYFRLMPKNIVVLAGEINSGKTAFLLNLAKMNMEEHDIYYFSSEMGALELRERLSMFSKINLEDWKCHFKERSDNFADVIKPDAFNIIDFLEIHEDFYRISKMLKDIHNKLNQGIAVVAIQKNRGVEFGLGAERSMEKARLYLTLSHADPSGIIKIVKAKNWRTLEENPTGLQRRFGLSDGWKFMSPTGWERVITGKEDYHAEK
jgi:hypothetical protein